MKKYLNKFISAVLCTALLSGCSAEKENVGSENGGNKSNVTVSDSAATLSVRENEEAAKEKEPKNEEDIIRMKMIERSLISTGNTERIQKAITKAKNGEEVTLAYLGGSITQGVGATPDNKTCYAALSAKLFAEKFAEDENNQHPSRCGVC